MIPITLAPKPAVQSQPDNFLAKVAPLVGGAVGAAVGGAPGATLGAAQGASLGMGIGGAAGGLMAKSPEMIQPQQPNLINAGGGAMGRRMAELNNDPQMQIRQSLDALKTQSPQMQAEYGPILTAAHQKLLRG